MLFRYLRGTGDLTIRNTLRYNYAMQAINRQNYPQLDKILWDNCAQSIDPTLAYRCYEQRWQFMVWGIGKTL